MSKVSNSMLFSHVQQFIREVYANQLRQAGFLSYKGEDIHWFRLVNGEVLHAIYFVAAHIGFPVFLEIGYGCQPMFIPPVVQQSPYMRPIPGYEQMYHMIPELIPGSMPYGVQRSQIHGLSNIIYRVPTVMVHCPADQQIRDRILDRVLSVLEPIDTAESCFITHKRWRSSEIENNSWLTMTPYFVEEVLYWEDETLYPYCMGYINGKIDLLESAMLDGKLSRKVDREEYVKLMSLKNVFLTNGRQQYIQELSNRASRQLTMLKNQII